MNNIGISEETLSFIKKVEKELTEEFSIIDSLAEQNSLNVLEAFHKHNASESLFRLAYPS